MKRVFSSSNPVAISVVRNLLAQEGIETQIMNEGTAAVSGEVPFFSAMTEVWVVNDADEKRGRAVAASVETGEARDTVTGEPWQCPRCGETIEGQFSECWNCTLEEDPDPRLDPEARCPECDYLLWHLPERRCPECGTPF
jgi:hypothetical protein